MTPAPTVSGAYLAIESGAGTVIVGGAASAAASMALVIVAVGFAIMLARS